MHNWLSWIEHFWGLLVWYLWYLVLKGFSHLMQVYRTSGSFWHTAYCLIFNLSLLCAKSVANDVCQVLSNWFSNLLQIFAKPASTCCSMPAMQPQMFRLVAQFCKKTKRSCSCVTDQVGFIGWHAKYYLENQFYTLFNSPVVESLAQDITF